MGGGNKGPPSGAPAAGPRSSAGGFRPTFLTARDHWRAVVLVRVG
ncbi:unnamed protein product, partial [Tilletia laevis]